MAHVQILQGQGSRKELLESSRRLLELFRAAERIPGQVQMSQGRGATPDQGRKEELQRRVGIGQVQNGQSIGLGQERAKHLRIVLDGVSTQVQVGE